MGYLDYRTRLAFIQATRQAYRHEQSFARIYQALADRTAAAVWIERTQQHDLQQMVKLALFTHKVECQSIAARAAAAQGFDCC